MEQKSDVLKNFIPLVAFIAEVCGKNFEVILHDVSTPDRSILAIHNGHISGRKLGGPMTDFAVNLVRENLHLEKSYICNYEGRTTNGKSVVSSTFFIMHEGELLGMICINHDMEDLQEMQKRIGNLMDAFSIFSKEKPAYTETLDGSIRSLSDNLIRDTVAQVSISPERMTPEEKIEIIRSLEQQGVFATKGSVHHVAEELSISEPTVYRYLKKINK